MKKEKRNIVKKNIYINTNNNNNNKNKNKTNKKNDKKIIKTTIT